MSLVFCLSLKSHRQDRNRRMKEYNGYTKLIIMFNGHTSNIFYASLYVDWIDNGGSDFVE